LVDATNENLTKAIAIASDGFVARVERGSEGHMDVGVSVVVPQQKLLTIANTLTKNFWHEDKRK